MVDISISEDKIVISLTIVDMAPLDTGLYEIVLKLFCIGEGQNSY